MINIFYIETALRSRFLFRRFKKKIAVAAGVTCMLLGVLVILIILCPIGLFKALYKIVNKI